MRQEHRLHKILLNFFVYRNTWPEGDVRRSAATEAIFHRIAIALMPGPAATGVGITALVGLYFAYQANSLLNGQNELLATQTRHLQVQTEQIEMQTALSEATRRASLNFELANILQGISDQTSSIKEGDHHAAIKLSNGLYGRIVALSRNLKPYHYLNDDGTLIERPLSPERGQLLIALHASGVDLSPVARDIDFTASDLERANLRGADLSDMVMSKSNLNGADLSKSSLRGTDLRDADLRNANLIFSDLSLGSDDKTSYQGSLQGASLAGCDFYGAVISYVPNEFFSSGARLHGVILTSPPLDLPKPYEYFHLEVRESLEDYPPQIVMRAFEFVEAAKRQGEIDYLTMDPLANAKYLIGNSFVVSDTSEISRMPIENSRLLQSKTIPQSYWKLPPELQEHFGTKNYYIRELPELLPAEPGPAPDLTIPGPAAPAPASPSLIHNSRQP